MTEKEPIVHELNDWRSIAQEIWDEYDAVALYLQDYMHSKTMAEFPFLEKMLPRRFKYFRSHHGLTMTIEEYRKKTEQEKAMIDSLYLKAASSVMPK